MRNQRETEITLKKFHRIKNVAHFASHFLAKGLNRVFLLLTVLTSYPVMGQGNLVINGGFDTDAAGWVLIAGGVWAGPDKGNPGGFVGLDSLAPSPTADPIAYQLINGLVPGQTYLVSGDYEKQIARTSTPGSSFGVALDNVFLFETSDPGNFLWHSFSFSYTATSTSAVLTRLWRRKLMRREFPIALTTLPCK